VLDRSKEVAESIATKKLIAVIRSICKENDAVQSAYVFGSFVDPKKKKKPKDIDLAVLLDETKSEEFFLPSFISALEKPLKRTVDVIVLNRAGEVLKYEVRRAGKLIFDRSPEVRKRFEVKGRKTYEDFLFLHKRYVSKVLYGIENG